MSAVLNNSQPVMAPHRKLTVGEYRLMGQVGILREDDRVELIEGEIIDMSPIGPPHSGTANILIELLGHPTRGRAIATVQNSIYLAPRSEPQPDFALLKFRIDRYKSRLPQSADVLLLVEIADSSMQYDRDIKLPLYARHGVPEYWIINIPEQRGEIYSGPESDRAQYRQTNIVTQGGFGTGEFSRCSIRCRGDFWIGRHSPKDAEKPYAAPRKPETPERIDAPTIEPLTDAGEGKSHRQPKLSRHWPKTY